MTAIRWSPEQLAEYQARTSLFPKQMAKQKYGSKSVEQDGEKFDSKKEARRWLELQRLAAAGKISQLERQVVFELAPPVRLEGEKRMKPALRYIADATYIEAGQLVVEDTKSPATRKTAAYRIKKHLMKSVHGMDIKEV